MALNCAELELTLPVDSYTKILLVQTLKLLINTQMSFMGGSPFLIFLDTQTTKNNV